MAQRAVARVETEVEDTESSLFTGTDEGIEVRFPADVQSHVTCRSTHFEFHVVTSDLGCFWQVEADVTEREAQ